MRNYLDLESQKETKECSPKIAGTVPSTFNPKFINVKMTNVPKPNNTNTDDEANEFDFEDVSESSCGNKLSSVVPSINLQKKVSNPLKKESGFSTTPEERDDDESTEDSYNEDAVTDTPTSNKTSFVSNYGAVKIVRAATEYSIRGDCLVERLPTMAPKSQQSRFKIGTIKA